MFIFYPIQKELHDNIAAATRHKRHSARILKTNTVEGLTVHKGCTGGNEEEIDCHSRIREENSHCHVALPKVHDCGQMMLWQRDKIVVKPKHWFIWQWFIPDHSELCGAYVTQKEVIVSVKSVNLPCRSALEQGTKVTKPQTYLSSSLELFWNIGLVRSCNLWPSVATANKSLSVKW